MMSLLGFLCPGEHVDAKSIPNLYLTYDPSFGRDRCASRHGNQLCQQEIQTFLHERMILYFIIAQIKES